MAWIMRKSTNSAAIRQRSRQLGVRPPSYSIPATQAEVQTSDELRQAAAEIVDQLDKRMDAESGQDAAKNPVASEGGAAAATEQSAESTLEFTAIGGEKDRRSGRGKANPRVIRLHI
jgi:hypothetical protein